jgi:predicted DNA-binding mobile mystery protein A
MKAKIRELHLKHVALRLNAINKNDKVGKPPLGWIRFIREALHMSSKALAERVGIGPNTLSEAEKAEVKESITLKRLRKIADSLNCDLVYYLLPREEIRAMVEKQARKLSLQKAMDTQSHMELEDQAVSKDFLEELIREEMEKLMISKKLWDE